MKVLHFDGHFSWDGKKIHIGKIFWCHIEAGDHKKIERIVGNFKTKSKGEFIILVPFAHLHHKVPAYKYAEDCFKNMIDFLPKNSVVAPFGVSKELHLSLPAHDNAVKFLNF